MQKFRFLTNSHLRVRVIQYDCVVLASYVDVVKWEVVLFADLGHLASGLVARSAAELSFSLTLAFLPPSLPLSLLVSVDFLFAEQFCECQNCRQV